MSKVTWLKLPLPQCCMIRQITRRLKINIEFSWPPCHLIAVRTCTYWNVAIDQDWKSIKWTKHRSRGDVLSYRRSTDTRLNTRIPRSPWLLAISTMLFLFYTSKDEATCERSPHLQPMSYMCDHYTKWAIPIPWPPLNHLISKTHLLSFTVKRL